MNLPHISNKTILISALDWGFGHTSRCVPIINQLLRFNNRIIFAGNSQQCTFIKKEFPSIRTEFIDGYNVKLNSNKNTYFQITNQLFKVSKAFKNELKWVGKFVAINKIDLILSDNRYGFRNTNVKSIFIGHQLNLQLPKFENTVNRILNHKINQFNSVWIIDDENINLAGTLSNPLGLTIPYIYIGLLSRFKVINQVSIYDYLIIISGPDPENIIFLKKIENLFNSLNYKIAIVSTVKSSFKLGDCDCDYFYFPSTVLLNQLFCQSKTIISKAGYTTLMELLLLNKKAILMPTKGQFEQEYLAKTIKNDLFKFIDNIESVKRLIKKSELKSLNI